MMNKPEKSDLSKVAKKPANNPGRSGAELVERREGAKGNTDKTRTRRTPSRVSVFPGLERVRERARRQKKERFTALLHHVSVDLLRAAFSGLKRDAAPGVDGLTWQEYEQNLDSRLVDLHTRVHRGTYRVLPSRRKFISKEDGRQRPLGIAALEDKIVQRLKYSMRSMKRISWDSRTVSAPDAASIKRWMRSRSESLVRG
jgi:RNA-directed DNA polymerase